MSGARDADRLRQELDQVRRRLEDEVAYHRGQAEAARRQAEAEHLRAQAAEVARRRRLEDRVADLEAQLRESQDHAARLQRRYDELAQQFMHQEEAARSTAQEEVERYRATAREAWRSAEEEVEAMEAEVSRQREALEQERARVRQLEDTLRTLQGVGGDSAEDQLDGLQAEAATLKKALNLSERARAQAQRRAVRLAEQLVELEALLHGRPAEAGTTETAGSGARQPGPFPASPLGSSASPQEVDLSEANAVLRRAFADSGHMEPVHAGASEGVVDLDGDLSDEFLLVGADESLDRSKLARLQREVETAEQEDRRHQEAWQQRRRNALLGQAAEQGPTDGPEKRAIATGRSHREEAAAPGPSSPGRGVSWPVVIVVMVSLVAAAGGAIWLLGGG
ncbi:MAG: hypothetical protein JJT90_00685 [Ectothiorhodospiraceae bacterium]|nr:hypothetical protein [Ectothiorhodospiraceae bacterium]